MPCFSHYTKQDLSKSTRPFLLFTFLLSILFISLYLLSQLYLIYPLNQRNKKPPRRGGLFVCPQGKAREFNLTQD